ncbi:hypothetical protein CARUB_v10016459mg, partial [Capsella rubella]
GRAFAGAPMFALGYYTNDALTPNTNRILKEAKQAFAEANSLAKAHNADLAKVIETKNMLEDLVQRCMANMIELKTIEKTLNDQVQGLSQFPNKHDPTREKQTEIK